MSGFLDGKVMMITGAGAGIGLAATRLFGREGAKVIAADIDRVAAETAAKAVEKAGGAAIGVACDVSDEDQVQRTIAAGLDRWGRLDGAFNNAGVGAVEASLTDDSLAEWRRILDVDLFGVMFCMKHEISAMLATGGGAIVNNASNAGKGGVPRLASYGAAKAGVINLSMTAAVEFASRNVRVNAVCPGLILTETMRKLLSAGGVEAQAGANIPAGRPGDPQEVAELAAWLLSTRASYVTGQAISVDGGMIAAV